MDAAIEILERRLCQNEKICPSSEVLHTFPPILFQPYCTSGIGIIICLKGSFTFTIDGKPFHCHAMQTTFLPKDGEFQVMEHSKDLNIMLLIYQVEPIRDNLGTTVTSMNIYSKIYPHQFHVYSTGKEEDLAKYIQLICTTMDSAKSTFCTFEQKLLLISLTYRLCAIFQQKMIRNNSVNARHTEVFLHLIELINEFYESERGVEFYADKLCLTPKYLSGLSKSLCGYTVQELVFKAIIRRSKTLLNVTNMTIQEISNHFHFPNASSFGTFFKKQTGVSPQKYRLLENHEKEQIIN